MVIMIMFLVGILLGVLIYTNAGQIGKIVSPLFGGLVGIIKYVIPVGIIIIAFSLIREERAFVTTKVTQFYLFLFCV